VRPEAEVNVIMRMKPEVFARHLREFARINPGEFRRMLNHLARCEGGSRPGMYGGGRR